MRLPAPRPARPARHGFTIVELLVAVMIMSIGVLGLASTAAVVNRQMGGGARRAQSAAVAQSRFETLRSTPCASIVTGTASTSGITERWVATSAGTRQFVVSDTVTFPNPTGPRTQVYRSYVRC
ncbi:MAG: prepilin-type N-terminal cleavage/methylation domain-containing protein [Gemmatimonadota bacterium]|nr:prepilin-type N-terminal cleavage/methylation domain-containing protein [Gemmatimonadota bacterium]